MESRPRQLRNYQTADGTEPFPEWIRRLKDREGRARIRTRLDRVASGNLGVWRSIGEGVFELIFDFGPGYRVYFGQDDDEIILLIGGDKSSQATDIQVARELWRDYNAEENQ